MREEQRGRATEKPEGVKLRERFAWLNRFSDDELREISFCQEGERLSAAEQYFDISHPERGVITARSGEQAESGSCLVAKSQVPAETWRKLTERLG